MTTQAIQSPANILAAPVPATGNSSASSSSAEVPFNQLLQREVAERRSAEQVSKSNPQQADASSGSPPSAQAPSQTDKPVSEAGKQDQEEAAADEKEQPEDAAAVSDELLALVANMTQLASAAHARGGATAPEAQTGIQIDPDAADSSGKQVPADIDALRKSGNAADKNQPAHAIDQMTAAKTVKAESAIAERTQQLNALQAGAAQTAGTTPLAAANGPAQQIASSLDAASSPTAPQSLMPMQQALNKMQAATTQAPDSLAPPVGTQAWDQAVGQKVVWMVAGAQQSASLTLNPPELGPMQIVLNVSNAQANATFVAPQAEVRQALEAALPRLREMLGEAGIQLGQTNINAGTPNNGGQFEQGGKPSSGHFAHDTQGEQPVAPVRQQAIRQGLGMVDTFA